MEKKKKTVENNIPLIVEKKISFFKDVMQRIVIHIEKHKMLDILSIGDISNCIDRLNLLGKQISYLEDGLLLNKNNDDFSDQLQVINNGLAGILKNYGTIHLEDLLNICLGEDKITLNTPIHKHKFELLKKYFHPTGYGNMTKYKYINVENTKNEKNDDIELDCEEPLKIVDIDADVTQYHMKIYGIKIDIYSNVLKKGLTIYGIIDNIIIDLFNDKTFYLGNITDFVKKIPENVECNKEVFKTFVSSLTLKDYFIINNDIYTKYANYCVQYNLLKKKHISSIVSEFVKSDMFTKFNMLKTLLIHSQNNENIYLSYLLYDLLSNETNGEVDTQDQVILFDSFPWQIKQNFKQAMKKTVQYTKDLYNFDVNKIPLEQRICLLNVNESVKEKAMIKLKEIKSKSEDSGTKARQYLDGLLKIPFNVKKREPILDEMDNIRKQFKYLNYHEVLKEIVKIPEKENYSIMEINNYLNKIKDYLQKSEAIELGNLIELIKKHLTCGNKNLLLKHIDIINSILNKHKFEKTIVCLATTKKDELIEKIINTIEIIDNIILKDFTNVFLKIPKTDIYSSIKTNIKSLEDKTETITSYLCEVKNTLDTVVHGHHNAKKQVERVIGQWINSGGNSDESHVLGFEGNPGIGKTTLAKGLAKCLLDENGISRPFALIAIGGDSNSSSLIGHSYTYVGSTWGQIVQILMDKKCMNPIILIDEVDKISKTEHGREIYGVLTHMLDPTQNLHFQDKYFSGIDIDLSKVLFILSYNDSESIDKIMLDRIHRIKFDSLTLEDKISICNKHLLPDLYSKIGLDGTIFFSDEVLKFIIEQYTMEPGVRKMKEKLFEIVGEINLEILKGTLQNVELPIKITIDEITNKYFKDKRINKIQKIHMTSEIGVINALWANEMAQGGILPLQVSFVPSNKFLDLTLTGSLGDVMKESIQVSMTTAWNLTTFENQQKIIAKYNNTQSNQVYGLHIHCPNISTKKDGPSATAAFTVIIYSLFNNLKIKNYVGMTGETSFDYCLTEIGGLREKIIHSIPAGITEFIYPCENQKDFEKIMETYKDLLNGISFHPVKTIYEVFEIIFVQL